MGGERRDGIKMLAGPSSSYVKSGWQESVNKNKRRRSREEGVDIGAWSRVVV
jgi:hypothetical protein